MSYRAWPAALLSAAALSAACVVVGQHAVETGDRCLDSAVWFTATPVGVAAGAEPGAVPSTEVKVPVPVKADIGPNGADDRALSEGQPISGCLDLSRIQIPSPTPLPDGRA